MPLSPEQEKTAQTFFRSNGVVPDCPYCGTSGWKAGEIISGTVVDEQGNTPAGSTNVAIGQSVCGNCGHVALFDAARVGL